MQRLGKNQGGYRGETIDIRVVLRDIEAAAQAHGWNTEVFHQRKEFTWLALHRPARPRRTEPARRIYISAGIHGDEPAGPVAVRELLREDAWPANAEVTLVPCLNPAGFTLNRRENADGLDLNRQYRGPKAEETRSHMAWLERQPPFNLYLCLHEDWESHGFYLYEQNPDHQPSLAERIIEAVRKVCPIDPSPTIEGRAAQDGIIRPSFAPHRLPGWPEAFYLITHKARQGYTLEAPSDFPLATRVAAEMAAVRAVLDSFGAVN
jgi:predicted deacylase